MIIQETCMGTMKSGEMCLLSVVETESQEYLHWHYFNILFGVSYDRLISSNY